MAQTAKSIRGMAAEDRKKLLTDTRAELMHERGLAAMGGSVKNPGRFRDLRTTIARILTVERQLGEVGPHDALNVPAAKPAKGAKGAKAARAAKAPAAASPAAGKPAKAKAERPAKPAKGAAEPKGTRGAR